MPVPNTPPHIHKNIRVLPTHAQGLVHALPQPHNHEHVCNAGVHTYIIPILSKKAGYLALRNRPVPQPHTATKKFISLGFLLQNKQTKYFYRKIYLVMQKSPRTQRRPSSHYPTLSTAAHPMIWGEDERNSLILKMGLKSSRSASPEHLLDMQRLRPTPRPPEPDTAF